jgi:hypothetical protein
MTTNPERWADRWFRRYEPDIPVAMSRPTLRYAMVRAAAAWRPGKRALYAALAPWLRRLVRAIEG